jgi:hypothetical protein
VGGATPSEISGILNEVGKQVEGALKEVLEAGRRGRIFLWGIQCATFSMGGFENCREQLIFHLCLTVSLFTISIIPIKKP